MWARQPQPECPAVRDLPVGLPDPGTPPLRPATGPDSPGRGRGIVLCRAPGFERREGSAKR